MTTKQKHIQNKSSNKKVTFLFTKENYIIIFIGMLFILTGFILMIGGGSDDPAVFNEAIFNVQRLTVAPILLLIGYALQFVAIFYNKKEKPQQPKQT